MPWMTLSFTWFLKTSSSILLFCLVAAFFTDHTYFETGVLSLSTLTPKVISPNLRALDIICMLIMLKCPFYWNQDYIQLLPRMLTCAVNRHLKFNVSYVGFLISSSSKLDLPTHFLISFNVNFFQLFKKVGVTFQVTFLFFSYTLISQSVLLTIPLKCINNLVIPFSLPTLLPWPPSVSWINIILYFGLPDSALASLLHSILTKAAKPDWVVSSPYPKLYKGFQSFFLWWPIILHYPCSIFFFQN